MEVEDVTCPAITLGGLTMDGLTPDGDGVLWTPTRLDGWWDSTAVRSGSEEAQPVGEYVTVARENARPISLEVTASSDQPFVTALGETLCFTAMYTIKDAARCVLVPETLYVTDPYVSLQSLVRRVGPIKQQIVGNLVVVHFLVPLLAPDPRRFDQQSVDDTITLGAGVSTVTQTVATTGTVNTPMVVTFKGPTTNPKILSHSLATASTRPFLQWTGSLANSADLLVIDTAAQTVLHNGVDASSGLVAGSQMFDLIAGNNSLTVSRTVTTGSNVNTVTHRDAFD